MSGSVTAMFRKFLLILLFCSVSDCSEQCFSEGFCEEKIAVMPAARGVMASVMQAVRVGRFGGPEVLVLEKNLAVPKPGDGEVLMRVHACGINPVEAYIRTGSYARQPELPYTPGSDAAGEVAAIGNGVTNLKVGDRVFTRAAEGGYAQFSLAKAESLQPLPERLSFEQGAALPIPYLTAYRAIFTRGLAKPGETLLIHGGTGGVGMAAIQLGLAQGLRVFATGGTEKGLELMRKLGVQHTFNHRQDDYRQKILSATEPQGVNIILENLANVNLEADLSLLGRFGRVMVVGSRGRIEIDPRSTMMQEKDIRGIALFNASPEEITDSYRVIQAGIASGDINPVIGQRFTLEQAAQAHDDILNNKGTLGKSVFTIE